MNIIKKIADSIFKKSDSENKQTYRILMKSMFSPLYSFNRLCSLKINSKTVDVINSDVVDILFNSYVPIAVLIDYEAYSENRRTFIKPALYMNDRAVDLYVDAELKAHVKHCMYYPGNGSILPMLNMSDEEFAADTYAIRDDITNKQHLLSYLSKTADCFTDVRRIEHLHKRIEKLKGTELW